MPGRKKQISAQTRVKQQQAAKRRRRGPKGSVYGGRFLAGLQSGGAKHHAINHRKGGLPPEFRESEWGKDRGAPSRMDSEFTNPGHLSSNELFVSHYNSKVREYKKKGMGDMDARREALLKAREYASVRTGISPDLDLVDLPVHVTVRDPDSDKKRAQRIMQGMMGADAERSKPKTTREYFKMLPDQDKTDFEDPNSQLRKRLAEGITTTGSVKGKYYNSPGERDRQAKYVRARAQGANREEAIRVAMEDKRGQRVAGDMTRADISRNVKNRSQKQGLKSKYETLAPRSNEIEFGIRTPRVSSFSELEKKFPSLSESDIVKYQQAERETIFDEFMKNQAWAHETRKAKMIGASRTEGPDRVSFLTTSVGYPNVSVPSDSLVGQYIIRKRKKLLENEGIARGSQLRGRFPEAVRDMHVMEFTTGMKFGGDITAGLMHKTGWRANQRKSKGYGKPVPVGSTILRDSTGAPVYDSEGNMRYSEGLQRRFKVGPERELGLGLYIG